MKSFSLTTELMQHQRAAVNRVGKYCIGALFMEMGTGKTRTAFELIQRRQHRISKVVWFCPVSLKQTIKAEILKHTDATEEDIFLFDDEVTDGNLPKADWHIVGIESISNSDRVALAVNALINQSSFVVVDESSYIKSHKSKRSMRITAFAARTRYRLILTGTPLSQGYQDLYSQMRFLHPKILGYRSYYSFAANHLEYSDKFPGLVECALKTEYLAAKIHPYTYQCTKDECLDLPSKVYSSAWCSFTDEQHMVYESERDRILTEMMDEHGDWDSIYIFKLFNALQQIACGFLRNGESVRDIEHKRLDALSTAINQVAEDRKIIIWSKYHYCINQIAESLKSEYGSDSVAEYHGKLNERQRTIQIGSFERNARFLVATQAVGGFGHNWAELSHHAIYYANTFKYSERAQSEDRINRIGQKEKCIYVDIVADCTIDRRIQKAIAAKKNVVDMFRDEVNAQKDLGNLDLKKRIEERLGI